MADAAHHPVLPIRPTIRRVGRPDLPAALVLLHRVLAEDLGYGLRPDWHADMLHVPALAAAYVEDPCQALFAAVAADGSVAGTAAVRADGPAHPPHPAWLAGRYAGPEAGQLARVWVAREHRRRGLARALATAAATWAAQAGYRVLCLHTDPGVTGAEAFWRSMPVREVWSARTDADGHLAAIHFEWPLDRPPAGLRRGAATIPAS